MDEIKAGRALDLEIGKRIFGITRVHFSDYDTEKEWPQFIPSGKSWRTHSIDARPLPAFSTNISAAFQVVEKLRTRSWQAVIEVQSLTLWRVRFVFGGMAAGTRKYFDAVAETAPLAICLAALSVAKEEESKCQSR